DAPSPAVDAEGGIARGDAEVAPERQLEAAGDGVAFDGGDDGLREQHARRTERARAVFVHAHAAAVEDRLQVAAGAEVLAGAGEYRDVRCVVGVETLEGLD